MLLSSQFYTLSRHPYTPCFKSSLPYWYLYVASLIKPNTITSKHFFCNIFQPFYPDDFDIRTFEGKKREDAIIILRGKSPKVTGDARKGEGLTAEREGLSM